VDAQGIEGDATTQPKKLSHAFQSHHIRLRLHGTRLPPGYTIALRLPSANNRADQPRKPKRRRRRKTPPLRVERDSATDSEADIAQATPSYRPTEEADEDGNEADVLAAALASDAEDGGDDEDEAIRLNNAYPGATNSIGSIHQRQWFLTLDRISSGFVKARRGADAGRWERARREDGTVGGFETFIVRGREMERSVVTGRLAADVMDDEGITSYAGRKMWRPITE